MILGCVSCTFALHIRRLYHCINWRNIHWHHCLIFALHTTRLPVYELKKWTWIIVCPFILYHSNNKLTNERCRNRGMARLTLYVFFGINTKILPVKILLLFIQRGFHMPAFSWQYLLCFVSVILCLVTILDDAHRSMYHLGPGRT